MSNMDRRRITNGTNLVRQMNDQILDHFRKYLGKEQRSENKGKSIDLHYWQASQKPGCIAITTVGMAATIQTIPADQSCASSEPRTELLIFSEIQDVNRLGQRLRALGDYPFKNKCLLHWWHNLSLGEPIVPNSPLTAIMLSYPPFEEAFATFHVSNKRVDVLWVVPLHESERKFMIQHGINALEDQFESQGVDVSDMFRPPVSGIE